jgi:hypothetical protein
MAVMLKLSKLLVGPVRMMTKKDKKVNADDQGRASASAQISEPEENVRAAANQLLIQD